MIECFVTYLAGHNRPMHEVLFGNEKNIAQEFISGFAGMTTGAPVALEVLTDVRSRIRAELPQLLTPEQRAFLIGLANAAPDWGLLKCALAAELPALRWKLANLQTFRKSRPAEFTRQARELEQKLSLVPDAPPA